MCKQCKYNYLYATKHETLLIMSIIDSFCPQINLFCETFNSSEYFQVVRENTNISSDLVRTRQKQLENFLTSTENATLVDLTNQLGLMHHYTKLV